MDTAAFLANNGCVQPLQGQSIAQPLQGQSIANYGAIVGGSLAPQSLGGRLIYLPPDILKESQRNLTSKLHREQKNNAIVAAAVLQSAVMAILGFKDAFKSLLSKGDDMTLLTNLNKCLSELQQANTEPLSKHCLSWLVTEEEPWITDVRELFEHCIKTIREFGPLLTGRAGINSHEIFAQKFSWTGWKQQALQIDVNNLSIGILLRACEERKEMPTKIFKEILCFHQSVAYITSCYQMEKYPSGKAIAGIYEVNEVRLKIPSNFDDDLEVAPFKLAEVKK